MSRSEVVRQQALERDGYRCQITGYGRGPGERDKLEVHHWRHLGIGGSEKLDNPDNMITLGPIVHEFEVHPGVSVPRLRIVRWVPYDELEGLIVERRVGDDWERVPDKELWFYRRHDAELVEAEIDLLRKIADTERHRAELMAHIWENYHLISDAKSPMQFIAGLGLDPNSARNEATAGMWIEENELEWPNGVNLRKVLLVRSSDLETREEMQAWLDIARDMSYSDLRKALEEEGKRPHSPRWYVRLSHGIRGQHASFIRSKDREAVLASLNKGDRLLEINAFRYGLKWDRKARKLIDAEGRDVSWEEI